MKGFRGDFFLCVADQGRVGLTTAQNDTSSLAARRQTLNCCRLPSPASAKTVEADRLRCVPAGFNTQKKIPPEPRRIPLNHIFEIGSKYNSNHDDTAEKRFTAITAGAEFGLNKRAPKRCRGAQCIAADARHRDLHCFFSIKSRIFFGCRLKKGVSGSILKGIDADCRRLQVFRIVHNSIEKVSKKCRQPPQRFFRPAFLLSTGRQCVIVNRKKPIAALRVFIHCRLTTARSCAFV
jgi:hypothetical protein